MPVPSHGSQRSTAVWLTGNGVTIVVVATAIALLTTWRARVADGR